MKGQTFEILGVIILIVAIFGIVVLSSGFFSQEQRATISLLGERQELEGFKAGVSSVLYTTEKNSGKTMLELLGIATYNGNYIIDFGVGAGTVDIKKELEQRFNSLYGVGHWYLRVPFPNITSDIQIVVVSDTSGSMCDEIKIVVTDVPEIIDKLRKQGKNVDMTLYLLGTPDCCVEEDGKWIQFNLNDYYQETQYFHKVMMPKEYNGLSCKNACGGQGSSDEDWGAGVECAILKGPYNGVEYGWNENAVKIAIPISDELPGGMECGCVGGAPARPRQLFERGLNAALDNSVTIFGFSGIACGYTHRGSGCQADLMENERCVCSKTTVMELMDEMSNKTGGKMYSLSNVSESAKAIEEIIINARPNRIPYLEAGTLIPMFRDINSVTIPIPVTSMGDYVELEVYYWS